MVGADEQECRRRGTVRRRSAEVLQPGLGRRYQTVSVDWWRKAVELGLTIFCPDKLSAVNSGEAGAFEQSCVSHGATVRRT